jgi:lysophospholipase L1-like esterase
LQKNDLLTFIEIATPTLGEDGKTKKEIFKKDKLHMNDKGYDIWTNTIKPVLDKNELKFEKK